MPAVLPVAGVVAGFGAGYASGAFQHLLYRQTAFRDQPARGRHARLIRIGLGLACAIAVALALRPDHYDAGPALLTAAFAIALLVLASTDFERRLLPNRLLYPAFAAAVALYWAWPDRDPASVALGVAFAAAVGVALFGLGFLAGGPVGGLGIGDIKLMLLIGALCGWPATMSALFLGVILGGLPALYLIVRGRGRSYFSYGPYLVLGALAVLLFPGRFV